MRLTAGGLRELDWHTFGEWAYMTHGSCRLTVLNPAGQAYVADVNKGDVWFSHWAIRIRCSGGNQS